MTPEEIGLLVIRIQNDDVLPSDMRRFLSALMQDEEIRRNARLVAALSKLPDEERVKYCLAHVLTLLTATQLAPPSDAEDWAQTETTQRFGEKFFVCLSGPWKKHIHVDGNPSAAQLVKQMRGRKPTGLPKIRVSKLLTMYVRAVQDFWGVPGLLV